MSTSTREPRWAGSEASSRASLPRWQRRRLSPVRGLAFIAAFLAILIAAVLNYDVVWDLLVQFVPWLADQVAGAVVGFFELFGMAPGVAGWAGIYLGVVVLLGLLYWLIRKAMVWKRFIGDTLYDYRSMYAYLYAAWTADARAGLTAWWGHLDGLGKAAAVVGAILILIPLLLGLSVGLGMLVAIVL